MTNPFEEDRVREKTPFDEPSERPAPIRALERADVNDRLMQNLNKFERNAINDIAQYAKKATNRAKEEITAEAKKELRKERRQIRKESKLDRKEYYQNHATGKKQGVTAGSTGPNSVEVVLTDWDQMLLAKYFPGQIDAPFVAGMNTLPVPTSTFHVSTEISQAPQADLSIDGARANLGTSKFSVLVYCPSLSSHLGTFGSFLGERLSGLQVLQSTSASTKIVFQDGFNRVARSRLCSELYGSDFKGFAQSGMIWASEMSLSMLAPAANVVGAVYEGAITLSQIPLGGLSVGDLIRISQKTHTGGTHFTLKGAVVNHNMIFNHHDGGGTSESVYEDLALETVHFLVFQTPVISIVDTSTPSYSFLVSIRGNYLFWPRATDPFANRLGQRKTQADSYLGRTMSASGLTPSEKHWYDPVLDYGKSFWNQHKTEIGDVLGTAAGALIPAAGGLAQRGIRMLGDFISRQTKSASGSTGSNSNPFLSTNPFEVKKRLELAVLDGPDYLIRDLVVRDLNLVRDSLLSKDFITVHRDWISDTLRRVEYLRTFYDRLPDLFDPSTPDPNWPLIAYEGEKMSDVTSVKQPAREKREEYRRDDRSMEDSFRR